MEVKFKCNINSHKITSKFIGNEKFWKTAHTEWWRLYKDFAPCQSGRLWEDVTITEKSIKHNAPYAHRMYEGDNFNFHKDEHPLASARWDKAAKPSQLPRLARTLNNYIKSGRFKF